jgi:hypothetical protein
MDAHIEGYLLQLTSINQDMPGVAGPLSEAQFNWQPAPGRWSVGQNVEHLNITTERYLPVLRAAIADARAAGRLKPGPFALGFFERLFVAVMEPPPRWRVKTRPAFVAPSQLSHDATLHRWTALQGELAGVIREAEGIDLGAIKVKSQFGPVSWTLNGTFTFLLAHQRRHVWQAREVRNSPNFPR